jgi:NADH dehydrogenase [ubiquinone] 1 alpha subcomplex assembly factor 7
MLERMVALDEKGVLYFIPSTGQNEESLIRETCAPAISLIEKISTHIAEYGGAALIIDYGYSEGSKGDTLQAMKDHAYHPVLQDAGEADITAHVDFAALMDAAKKYNVNVYGVVAQGQFLMRLGAGVRTTALCEAATIEQQQNLISGLKRLADPQEMGELFKVMAITSKNIPHAEGF